MATHKKLQINTPVISADVPGRRGKVLGLNKAGFYTVRWQDAVDAEGLRLVTSGEVRQYRRNEIVSTTADGKLDDVEVGNVTPTEENLLDNVLPFRPDADSAPSGEVS